MKQKNIITVIILVTLFVLTASIGLAIDLSKNIKLEKYFNSQVLVTYGNNEEIVTLDKFLSKSSGDMTNIKKIIFTCNSDIKIQKIMFEILAETEDIINLKILVNDNLLDDNPAILTNNGTKKISINQQLNLKDGDTYTIEFDCNFNFDIYNLKARK